MDKRVAEKLAAFREHRESFIEACCRDPIPYAPKAISNIEAFYWWSLVGYYKPDVILESGVCRGRSTEVLARAQAFFGVDRHMAFDVDRRFESATRQRLSRYKTEYRIVDAVIGFEQGIREAAGGRVLAVTDGPKYGQPLAKLYGVIAQAEAICAVASHDCYPGSVTLPMFVQAAQEIFKCRHVITSPEVNADASDLNDYIADDMEAVLNAKRVKRKINMEEMLNCQCVGICFGDLPI